VSAPASPPPCPRSPPPPSCVNLVTEYFTSGNLREYRQRHRHLGAKAVRKWARQILSGLAHLHTQVPPIVHGDLRCDKIYINGHSGEIKIGDLGLATLAPARFAPAVLPPGVDQHNQYNRGVDIFAFGLVVLELATTVAVDGGNCGDWPALLARVADEGARAFIHRCLGPAETRPTATELLDDPFLARPKEERGGGGGGGRGAAAAAAAPAPNAAGRAPAPPPQPPRGPPPPPPRINPPRASADSEAAALHAGGDSGDVAAGAVRGEDYEFQFSGRVRRGALHFRLHMAWRGSDDDGDAAPPGAGRRTVDFVYDPDADTPGRDGEGRGEGRGGV